MTEQSMNPEADDLYECLGAEPREPHSQLTKKIARFQAKYINEYPDICTEIERKLNNINKRREFNKDKNYPETFADVVLSLRAPDAVEVDEEAPITVENADGDPIPHVTVSVDGDDVGTTDDDGQITVLFERGGTVAVEASKDDPDRSYTSPETTVEVVRERRTLYLTADVNTVTVHEPVSFTVTDDGGNPVEDAVVEPIGEHDAEWSATTDRDGTCQQAFETVGTKTVHARKDDTEDTRYEDADGVELEVEPRDVFLDLSADRDTAEVGEPVGFSVTDEDGTPIPNVTLLYGDEDVTTNTNGEADIRFEETGSITVTANKSSPNAEYESDEIDVTIERRTRNLSVSASPGSLAVGDSVTVTVTDDDGSPVEDATVTAGGQEASTSGSGTCTLPAFSEPGDVTVRAEKRDTPTDVYDPDETTISVTKAVKDLQIRAARGTVKVRTPISIDVTDGSGNPVGGARVKTPSETVTTDQDGCCTVEFTEVGTVDVTARKTETETATYSPDDTTVTVEPREISLSISTDGDGIEVNRPFDVTVTDSNGTSVEGVRVTADAIENPVTTGSDGTCRPTITATGQVTIRASKSDADETVTYSSDRTTVEVDRQERDLVIEVDADEPVDTGTEVPIIVRDDLGQRLEGATVVAQGNSYTTDERGVCRIEFTDASVTFADVRRDDPRDWIDYVDTRQRIELAGDHRPTGEPEGLPQWAFLSLLLVPVLLVLVPTLVLFELVDLLPMIATLAVLMIAVLLWMMFQKL